MHPRQKFELQRQACADQNLGSTSFRVFCSLLSRAGKHGTAWPSLELIAKDSGTSVKAAKAATAELSTLGYLTKKQQGHRRTCLYSIKFPGDVDTTGILKTGHVTEPKNRLRPGERSAERPDSGVPKMGSVAKDENELPFSANEMTEPENRPGGGLKAGSLVAPKQATEYNNENNNENIEKGSDPLVGEILDSEEADFLVFLSVFGRRSVDKKAQREFSKVLKSGDINTEGLIACAQAYVTEVRRRNASKSDGDRFIMGPARWLEEGRWKDAPATPLASTVRTGEELKQYFESLGDKQ